MGKRLSKIYTRTGDQGETGLGDGTRISKRHPRLEAIGNVDELNSAIGILIEALREQPVAELQPPADFLRGCQHRIFDLGGELSIPGYAIIDATHTESIEQSLDELNANLPPLDNFILPGGSRLIAEAHLARAVCRRAERSVVALGDEGEVNPHGLTFLNRLSDYLFVLARHAASVTHVEEVLWQK
ncbi:MAG: cob(I)yrinic acid a,c-diamide adenosyltransferase [Proteobacteria bacterium]|nr:cob(I)yrinic acid a,c-diamide adenosyltransferase [Pseudomonadota bacterium]MDA1300578.1 cob(I)yrinic acid a,c-diamide adenosyltransferase [Pseudomonadota bacterium]